MSERQSKFKITFHISHPLVPAIDIQEKIGLPIKYSQSVGDVRTTKSGRELGGSYRLTNIGFRLHDSSVSFASSSIDKLLRELMDSLDVDYLEKLQKTGGTCDFLIGIFSSDNVMFEISPDVVRRLAEMNCQLKFDFYGGQD